MPSKYQIISELASQTARDITSRAERYTDFLVTAANNYNIGWIGLSEAPFDIQEALAKRCSGDNVLHNRLRKYERYLFEQRHRGSL